MRGLVRLVTAVLLAWVALGANAQDKDSAAAQNPAPINTIELEAAYRHDFARGGANESHVRVIYKGALVREEGTPLKSLSAFDPAASAPATANVGSGDRNKWNLRYEDGRATVGGALLSAAGVQPLSLRGLESLDIRGTAQAASDAEGKNVEFAVGLETAPFRLPGLSGTEATNWLVFGINAQRAKATAADGSASTDNAAVLNYRAFVGKAFGWRKSADAGKTASKIERDLLAAAPTLDDAKALLPKIRKIPPLQRTALQRQLLDTVVDMSKDEEWTQKVREVAMGLADAALEQPTLAAYAEAHGWYAVSGPAELRHLRGLFTATLDYWFLPVRDDVLLRLRYESGWDWALPAERINRLLVSVALRF